MNDGDETAFPQITTTHSPGTPGNFRTMASQMPCRSLRVLARPTRPSLRTASLSTHRRALSCTTARFSEEEAQDNQVEKPRWLYTPPGTKAPFSLHFDSTRPEYKVNESQEVLDNFYIALLGPGGDKVLSDKLKWLAVTHKSFDQGRRGFNDRLGFLGMFFFCRLHLFFQ